MEEYKETIYWVINMLLGAFTGSLCGLLPLLIGIKRKKIWLGISGLIICMILGTIIASSFLFKAATICIYPAGVITMVIFFLSINKFSKKKRILFALLTVLGSFVLILELLFVLSIPSTLMLLSNL